MHILFHNNTIFNNWFFFMFSVAFLDRYHGTVPQACTTSQKFSFWTGANTLVAWLHMHNLLFWLLLV